MTRLADLGYEWDDGKVCESCWATGRAARIREDTNSGRHLCKVCEPHPLITNPMTGGRPR